MTLNISAEEAAAIFFLAGSELSVIKSDEVEGLPTDQNEINILISILNQTNTTQEGVIEWGNIPPAPDEPGEDDDEELPPGVLPFSG